MKKNFKLLILPLFFLGAMGCHKPDPHPEAMDPIYKDIEKAQGEVKSQLDSESKAFEEAKNEVKKVVPQTGQIKYAQKHYFDSVARLQKLKQLHRYYTLRLKSRESEAQELYLKAFAKDQPWPDPEEFEVYKITESARTKSRHWSVKERIEKERGPAMEKPAGEGGGEGGAAPKEKE